MNEAILEISAAMSVMIVLMLVLTPLLGKKYTSRLQYIIWLVIAVRLCIPINITIPTALFTMLPRQHTAVNVPEIHNDYNAETVPDTEPVTPPEMPSEKTGKPLVSSYKLIRLAVISTLSNPFIWAAGALIFFFRHIISYLNFRRKVRPYLRKADIECRLNVYICEKIAGPMMTGFFKPVIILPDIQYTEEEIELILKHELTHYKHGDIWFKLLLIAANAVHFFNPLVYIMRRHADRVLEYVCDEAVCKDKSTDFKKAYSMTILKTMQDKNNTAFSGSLSREGTDARQRFKNIFSHKRRGGILPVIFMLIISFVVCGIVSIDREYTLTSVSPGDVGMITVFDGHTGRQISITDKEDTEHIINDFNNTKMRRSGFSLGYMGYSLRVTIYGKDMKKYKEFILNSPTQIRDDPFFYTAPYAVDYYYIKNLFEPAPEETD